MKTIRDQLEPHIKKVGVYEIARRCADTPGVNAPRLYAWLSGTRNDGRPRRFNDQQLEAIARAAGVKIKITR